jgi:prevent-host-death family protein
MIKVSVRDLKNNLSAYLRRLQNGEPILITSHGKPVARLMPASEAPSEDEALERLHAHPLIRPGKGGPIRGARNPIKTRPGECLSEILLERE